MLLDAGHEIGVADGEELALVEVTDVEETEAEDAEVEAEVAELIAPDELGPGLFLKSLRLHGIEEPGFVEGFHAARQQAFADHEAGKPELLNDLNIDPSRQKFFQQDR